MPEPSTEPTRQREQTASDYSVAPFATISLLFFMWGFITVMNDVLIPFLKEGFDLTYYQAGFVQFAFFTAFFVVSLAYYLLSVAWTDPINRIGYKSTILVALGVCALGCVAFHPAATAQSYPLFLGALFLLASGVTLLQVAANPYAAILGRPENASSRLNLAQGLNSLGTTLAPIAGGLLLYKVFATDGVVTIDAIKTPYLIYGGMFLALSLVVAMSPLPPINKAGASVEGAMGAFDFPQLRRGMAAIFLYVGAEVAIGSFLVNFMADETVMGWPESTASIYLAYYWGGAMVGRLCGAIAMAEMPNPTRKPIYMLFTSAAVIAVVYVVTAARFESGQLVLEFTPVEKVAPFLLLVTGNLLAFFASRGRPARVLLVFSLVLIVLLTLAGAANGSVALWAALGVGLFNSIMWSNIFTLSIDGLEEHTAQGSSLLVMMIVGGALFPLLMGKVADELGIRAAFYVPIVSYLYIAYFAWWCERSRCAGDVG